MTTKAFQKAMRTDGNLKMVANKRAYVVRQIQYCLGYQQLTPKQAESLNDWAHTKFKDK